MEGRDATANCQLARSTNTARLSIMISCPLPSLIYQKRRRERERSKTRYWSRMEDDAIAARSCLLHNNTQATMTIVSLIGGCCAPWENDVDARLTDIFLISICRLDHGTTERLNEWTKERTYTRPPSWKNSWWWCCSRYNGTCTSDGNRRFKWVGQNTSTNEQCSKDD